jgi:multidrug efflux system membrane fusion protein
MSRTRRYLVTSIVGIVLIAVVGAVYWQSPERSAQRGPGGPGGRFQRGGDQPVPILAASAKLADVPVYLDGVGTTRALNTVTVRAQVDGKLLSLNFKEGQDVERGFVLAQIDPTLYQAQYDQAVAKKAQDEALLANAKRDLDRYVRLAATNALATQQADTQRSLVAQYEAQVKADQAAIDNAKGVLDYTTITAPLAGRTGIRLVDVGNIIKASDTTGIVTITQIKPISVIFTLPQQQLGQVNKAFARGPLRVDVFGSDNKTVIESGTLQVVDNQVDQATGTVRMKAEFPNANLQLWPGQFVNVRMLVETLDDVVVVPSAAVQRGPNGLFVFVVRDDDTLTVRPVTVSQQDELQTVVTTGLRAGERVATTSFNQVAEGSRVIVGAGEPGVPPPVANPANRPRGGPRARSSEGSVQSDEPARTGQRRSERTEGTSRTP